MRSLASDNHCGVHPALMQAILSANDGHAASYQTDPISVDCQNVWQRHFGEVLVTYVFNGTAANVLALRAITPGFGSILCSDVAHVHTDAGASPEFMLGCKVQPVPAVAGKLTNAALLPFFERAGDQHVAPPRALSLTQPTELGTVYTAQELQCLCDFAHARGLLVHMDGARLIHAASHLGCSLRAVTRDVGVDALAFGGTKNGLLGGEAVLLFAGDRAQELKYLRKQLMQLPSKTRFVAAQFRALLGGSLWQTLSLHCVHMAQKLAAAITKIPGVTVLQAVEANMVFASFPKTWVKPLRRHIFFYVWQASPCVARFVTSFDTSHEDIDVLVRQMQVLSLV